MTPGGSPREVERLPLFPLATVLFPGLVLPLHVFEDRYRRLVRELLAQPESVPRRFGVVAIKRGGEAGGGRPELYDVGCTAEVRRVEPLADGRFNLVTVGGTRFRVREVDTDVRPFLVGEVTLLDEPVGDPAVAAVFVARLRVAFAGYLAALLALRGEEPTVPELPADPVHLSHLVPATALLDLADRQRLLGEPDAASRLRAALAIVARERGIVEQLHAVPAPDLLQLPRSAS